MVIANSKCVLVAVLIGATIQIIMCGVNKSKFTKFYAIPTLMKGNTPTLVSSPTFMTCIVLCSREKSCSIVNYNYTLGECELMDWRALNKVLIPRNNTGKTNNIAVQSGKKQLYLSHTEGFSGFTFAEAEPLCQRVGGRLSADTDVILARDNDHWGVCGCGFVNDGRAVYHVNESSDCAGYKDGVCSNQELKYEVHCTVL